ncbi:ferritin-like domain-containing protein [Bacillus sp. 165]|uniref:ferritin-like domain-containing protein n=1 Tax=Bacillus sp. 165 TaxID=1529117 RepID=UPI001ADD20C8|nr:ferritin-like domain-containing protein [Bacillus sp. 165]
MDGNEVAVKELNAFLKGRYMGIHAYEHFIQKLKEPDIKKEFQQIQQDHKKHAQQVAERIQNLGGTPADDEGMLGSIQSFFSQFTIPDTTEGIIKSALKGEDYYGIEVSEEIVRGDLDMESQKIIEGILDEDRKHVELLNSLIQ